MLAARLSDARFFYDTDRKVPLADQAKKLDRIVFHEKLGTVADKVERVAKLARWLVEEGIVKAPSPLVGEGRGPLASASGKDEGASSSDMAPHPSDASRLPPSPTRGEGELADLAERAARLCKADLVTGMVGEFPELQGVMGGYYALAQGEDPQVAAAIRDHYKPVGQGDEVPTAPVTVAVSLADKLDTLFSFFAVGERPTGSKDPFALRRAALGVIGTLERSQLRLPLLPAYTSVAADRVFSSTVADLKIRQEAVRAGLRGLFGDSQVEPLSLGDASAGPIKDAVVRHMIALADAGRELLSFFADRLKVQQREAGVRHDLIDAVFALGGEDDLVRLLARVRALQAFVGTEDGANLLAGYKRAANILKKEGYTSPLPAGEEGARSASAEWEGEGRDGAAVGAALTLPPALAGSLPLPPGEGKPLSYTPEKDEAALHAALDSAEPAAAHAVAAEEFEAAMAALATLRAPIDAFFDTVTVNDPDPARRSARLALLARVRDAVHTVADFSKIEG